MARSLTLAAVLPLLVAGAAPAPTASHVSVQQAPVHPSAYQHVGDNYCADEHDNDLAQTHIGYHVSLRQCQEKCEENDNCSGVEWYPGSENCNVIAEARLVAKAHSGPRFMDAICYVKRQPEMSATAAGNTTAVAGAQGEMSATAASTCPDQIVISGSVYNKGTYDRISMMQNFRPIYKKSGGWYIYYWLEYNDWRVGSDYNNVYAGLQSKTTYTSCPNEAPSGEWFEWLNNQWELSNSIIVRAACQEGDSYVLAKDQATCWSPGGNRLYVGNLPLRECAKAVAANPQCGTHFELDSGNNNWCGCGEKFSTNADCTERGDHHPTSKIYKACRDLPSESRRRRRRRDAAAADKFRFVGFNFCADVHGNDLVETFIGDWIHIENCKQICESDKDCTGFEFYPGDASCHVILEARPASRAFPGPRFKDATCYVKKNQVSSRECSAHAGCRGGLSGNCCPNDHGLMLDCCGTNSYAAEQRLYADEGAAPTPMAALVSAPQVSFILVAVAVGACAIFVAARSCRQRLTSEDSEELVEDGRSDAE